MLIHSASPSKHPTGKSFSEICISPDELLIVTRNVSTAAVRSQHDSHDSACMLALSTETADHAALHTATIFGVICKNIRRQRFVITDTCDVGCDVPCPSPGLLAAPQDSHTQPDWHSTKGWPYSSVHVSHYIFNSLDSGVGWMHPHISNLTVRHDTAASLHEHVLA